MKLVITNPAKARFREIYEYYNKLGLAKVARKIRSDIYNRALILKSQPFLGPMEQSLEHLDAGYRYMVIGNYKIIYRIDGQTIYMTDIFDTRQDPEKMKP